jgi:hypothetical protein
MKNSDTMLPLIAFVEAISSFALMVGLGALKLIHRDVAALVEHWVNG